MLRNISIKHRRYAVRFSSNIQNFRSPANFREIMGICQSCLHVFSWPRQSIRSGHSGQSFGEFCENAMMMTPCCWCQVILFLFTSLCPGRRR